MIAGFVERLRIERTFRTAPLRRRTLCRLQSGAVFLALVSCAVVHTPSARASSSDDVLTDPIALVQLEQHAMSAEPREQCFLFTQLLHSLTEEAGRELAAGEEEKAQATLKHADAVMGRMHTAVQSDAKRLKNAELLMQHASRRLSDMLRVASDGSRSTVQSTLQKLNALHTELLTQVFAK